MIEVSNLVYGDSQKSRILRRTGKGTFRLTLQTRIVRLIDRDFLPRRNGEVVGETGGRKREIAGADAPAEFAVQVFQRAVMAKQRAQTLQFVPGGVRSPFQLARDDGERIGCN